MSTRLSEREREGGNMGSDAGLSLWSKSLREATSEE